MARNKVDWIPVNAAQPIRPASDYDSGSGELTSEAPTARTFIVWMGNHQNFAQYDYVARQWVHSQVTHWLDGFEPPLKRFQLNLPYRVGKSGVDVATLTEIDRKGNFWGFTKNGGPAVWDANGRCLTDESLSLVH